MTKGEISAFIDTISPTGPGGVIKIKKVLRELLKQKKEGEIVTVEELEEALLKKQDTLVSGENVKTVGGQSIVGKGNIEVGDKDAIKFVLQQLTEVQKAQARANIDAYKKPSTGIPASDIATGVIPDISGKQDTIPDLSTIRSGAAAGATSVQPAEFNELKDEVDTIGNGAYEEAWDGDSTPVVADIPAGVVVTYSSASYTGTLAASASTVDKIYLVSDGNGNYDRYTTVEANGAYSWKKVGSTAIPLSNYSTKSEVSQLEAKVINDYGCFYDNPDYIRAYTDSEGRFLWGIKTDGSIEWAKGVPTPIAELFEEVNMAISTLSGNVETVSENLSGKVDKETGKELISSEIASALHFESNPEYIAAYTDKDERFLWGIRTDGSIEWSKGIPKPIQDVFDELAITTASNPEFIEVKTDKEGRMLESTTPDGVTTHFNKHIFAGGIALGDGTAAAFGDWSHKKELTIPEPRCAVVNFSGIRSMPTTKTTDAHATMEFWDMSGNYFKKKVIANAQGRSTLNHPKKNIAIDICNDDWVGDDTFVLKIGDWVPQDSFHLKGYYNDAFRGVGVVAYKLYDKMCKTRGQLYDYVWKRATLPLEDITSTSNGASSASDTEKQFTNGARCFPDGFPCIVYLNGEFYGIFSWQLKKHRDNYRMSKKNPENIHLDGIISYEKLFVANGDSLLIKWEPGGIGTEEGFEIRNPKDIITTQGKKYDADDNSMTHEPAGLNLGETANEWDGTTTYAALDIVSKSSHLYLSRVSNNIGNNPDGAKVSDMSKAWKSKTDYWIDITGTNGVRQAILALSTRMSTIASAYATYNASSKTAADKATFKSVFETYFDPGNLIDYRILGDVLKNYDGFGQNWQWITYDGTKWFIVPYDCDGTFGNWWELNNTILAPNTEHQFASLMYIYIDIFYIDEQKARYAELRDEGVIDAKKITSMVAEWLDRIGGTATFEKEWARWPSFIKNDSILRLAKWIEESIANMDNLYNYNN